MNDNLPFTDLHFEAIFNQSFQFALILDHTGIVLKMNQLCRDICGKYAENVIGKPFWDAGWWCDVSEARPLTREAIKKVGKGEIVEDEVRFKDGNDEIHIGTRIFSPIKDETGRIVQISVAGLDVTEKKQADARLLNSEYRFRQLFEKSAEAIFIVDKQTGRYLDANAAAEKLTGRSIDDLKRLTTKDLTPVDAEKRLSAVDSKSNTTDFGEVVYVQSDQQQKIARLTTVPIDETTVFGIAQDITKQKLAEKLEKQLFQSRKMESVGTLAGGIAHEFNNILSIIMGNNELILQDLPDWSLSRGNAEEIRAASLRARDIIKQLMTFSRQDKAVKMPIDIHSTVLESIKLIRATIPTNIEISKNIEEDCQPVLGNPTQINQILINLCNNAADALPVTGGIIEINLRNVQVDNLQEQLSPGKYVQLRVSDNGEGMEKKIIDRVFEPYFTTKAIGKGSGIGLSVVHGIVENHGGSILCESNIGEGTQFTILLPAYTGTVQDSSDGKKGAVKGREHILYVDDESSIVKLAKRHLIALGYTVSVTTDPLEALEWIKEDPNDFDLVISDMAMPHMTGDLLIQQILKIRPTMRTLISTGYSSRISESKALELGVTGFIMKPLMKSELAAKVREVLDQNA